MRIKEDCKYNNLPIDKNSFDILDGEILDYEKIMFDIKRIAHNSLELIK